MSRHGTSSTGNICLYFLAIFIPPVAVLLRSGCSSHFFINILLTILGWIPGIIHAWYVISRRERTKVIRTSAPIRSHHGHGMGRPPVVQTRPARGRRW